MRASVSCQGAAADTIGQIVYKWHKKYTQLVQWVCCPISALHGRHANLYKEGEIHCDVVPGRRQGQGTAAALKLEECRLG